MKLRMVICTVESQPHPGRGRHEPHLRCLELPLSSGCETGLERLCSSEGLDHHGSMTAVLGVSDFEAELVELVGDRADDLGNGTLSSGDELHSSQARGRREVAAVYVLDRLEGLDDPPG